jgi:hypothetical protein
MSSASAKPAAVTMAAGFAASRVQGAATATDLFKAQDAPTSLVSEQEELLRTQQRGFVVESCKRRQAIWSAIAAWIIRPPPA